MMVLEAVAAPCLPRTRIVPRSAAGPIFEFRTYDEPAPLDLFRRAGIDAIRQGNIYMIPFRSLTERQAAWDSLASSPEWRAQKNPPVLTSLSIYSRIA